MKENVVAANLIIHQEEKRTNERLACELGELLPWLVKPDICICEAILLLLTTFQLLSEHLNRSSILFRTISKRLVPFCFVIVWPKVS